jgi:SAM-dependent methyltransferase
MTAGDAYLAAITARRDDRRARAAFQARALALTSRGGTILDFGAGPGLDAAAYAAEGRRVCGYDVDPVMQATFLRVCGREIADGRVALWADDYATFLGARAIPDVPPADLVTANFAPLNLVGDLRPLFAAFRALTSARGRVLASVLNPGYLGDLRYRWWWTHQAEYRRRGSFAVAATPWPVHRHAPSALAVHAAPFFVLRRVTAGTPPADGWPPIRLLSRYLFVEFEKAA